MLPKAISNEAADIVLTKNKVEIVFSNKEPSPLKIAVEALIKDFENVLDFSPLVTETINGNTDKVLIVIVNRESEAIDIAFDQQKRIEGFESHRVYADHNTNRIYLEGYDMRGTIYAIYTFCEEILGVPPLHYWSSWIPPKNDSIQVIGSTDIIYNSPQVKYRAFLPGDQDFLIPWRKISETNENIWLETVLRLKLNTVETYSTINPGHKLTSYAYLIDKYGLIITSHHISGLNTSFSTWNSYWTEVRNMQPPRFLLSNEQAIFDFFKYNAETVHKSNVDNLWTLAFRGARDQPFWSIFEDAPEDDKNRAEVINQMWQHQFDILKEATGEQNPDVRITFYDEIADLLAKGYLKPPNTEKMIWTFVAARRDPYPYDDIVNFHSERPVRLGYYMNFNFASTGAHVAPAEGPWKMEFNFRYVNQKSPLFLSVVNVGNVREFLLELSANSKMLWDFDAYDSDKFMVDYAAQYFGEKHAHEIAQLYKDFFYAYWEPKSSVFPGLERQFIFQDLRYARAFDHILRDFFSNDTPPNLNPLRDIGYERTPGRTFRIDLEDNKAENQVDAMIKGMLLTIPKFESVALRSSEMMFKLEHDKQTFFNDNLRVFSYYMTHLSKTLYHFLNAYKYQTNREVLLRNLNLAHNEAVRAQQYLHEAQHGVFSTWYSNADPLVRTFQIDKLINSILALKEQAQ